ncbi:hypothetical protein KUTeg_008410 [Tegillarca granosa]|uniref:Uncharacterized protein n=1 Tax=Tegillarca granosa TaxID=220873 RepID=A0ABQ9F924_TEGGR|nr:hypothetical protein KUTeg_008410 [Tegillarca granosa]
MYKYIRQLLCLPFLPSAHIQQTFNMLKERANSAKLNRLVNYIQRQWMQNTVSTIPSWCLFGQTIRANNDVEGWHHRLNAKATEAGLGFYRLVPLLRREAELVTIKITSDDLERDINARMTKLENNIQTALDRYVNNEVSTSHFLKICANLYAQMMTSKVSLDNKTAKVRNDSHRAVGSWQSYSNIHIIVF